MRFRGDRFNDVIPTKNHSSTTIVFKLKNFVDRKLYNYHSDTKINVSVL